MSAVFDAIGDFAGDVFDFVGDVGSDVIKMAGDAIQAAAKAIESTVSAALKDPIGTLATIATAVYAPYMLPVVSAGRVVANGGDLEDALKAAAVSYVSGEAGQYVGNQVGTSLAYGTDPMSAQTAMLAAQSGDMLGNTWAGTAGTLAGAATSGATAGMLTGGDPIEMALNALGTAGIRMGTNYSLNAAGQLVNSAGDLVADTSGASEITNPAQEGEEGFGWKYFSDGTAMSPTGEYYKNGEMVWSPYATEEVSGLTSGANLVENTAREGEAGYGWKYYDNGVVISPEGEYYQDGKLVWSPYEGGAQSLYGSDYVKEIPNTAQEGQEGYGWRYFTNGSVVDPEGNYYDAEGNLLQKLEPEKGFLDSDFAKGAKDYFTRQFTGALSGNVQKSLYNALFGSPRGMQAYQQLQRSGLSPTYANITALGYGDIFAGEEPSATTEQPFSTASSTGPAELFNPTKDMTWAPQTKLSGLGFAGNFVNQDSNTYFPNKDQENKQKLKDEIQSKGWLTDEERQQLLEQNQNENQFFDFENPINYAAPWMQEQPTYAAEGGLIDHNPEFYSEGGASFANRYVKGDGDGTSDSVPAMLASGEFVIPADVVSSLGNGDNDAGAKVLDGFMHEIRKHKRSADPTELPPDSVGPLEYLAQAQKKVRD